jgi:hypothetical protein
MPTSTYTPLATVTLGSSASSVTFSSIPATYRDLVLVYAGSTGSFANDLAARFNSDTGSNYSRVAMFNTSSNTATQTFLGIGNAQTGTLFNTIAQFMDYSATDKHKTALTRSNQTDGLVEARAGRWANTAAISSINVFLGSGGNFNAGATFNLYGIVS